MAGFCEHRNEPLGLLTNGALVGPSVHVLCDYSSDEAAKYSCSYAHFYLSVHFTEQVLSDTLMEIAANFPRCFARLIIQH